MLNQQPALIKNDKDQMKKLILFVAILLFFTSCNGQDKKDKNNSTSISNPKELKTFYDNGNVNEIQYLDENEDVTKWERYYEKNGKIALRYEMRDGKFEGMAEEFYENGKLKIIGRHKNDIQDGEWKTYFEDGLEEVLNYKDGEKDGDYKAYRNGQLVLIGKHEKGKEVGEWKGYYENKTLERIVNYKNRELTGKAKYYYENGKLRAEGNYEDYNRIGEWKEYDEQGNLIRSEKH